MNLQPVCEYDARDIFEILGLTALDGLARTHALTTIRYLQLPRYVGEDEKEKAEVKFRAMAFGCLLGVDLARSLANDVRPPNVDRLLREDVSPRGNEDGYYLMVPTVDKFGQLTWRITPNKIPTHEIAKIWAIELISAAIEALGSESREVGDLARNYVDDWYRRHIHPGGIYGH